MLFVRWFQLRNEPLLNLMPGIIASKKGDGITCVEATTPLQRQTVGYMRYSCSVSAAFEDVWQEISTDSTTIKTA